MTGMDAHYIPGWDCHGLPIEWKVEEDYRARGRDKDAAPIPGIPPRMPRIRRAVDRHPARGIQAPRRARRLGQLLHYHVERGRGGDRRRNLPLRHEWRPLPGHQAGALVGRGEDRARRRRGRIPRPCLALDPCRHAGAARAGRPGRARHLDDDALDYSRQSRPRGGGRGGLCAHRRAGPGRGAGRRRGAVAALPRGMRLREP